MATLGKNIDTDKYRLRSFVEKLNDLNEVDIHSEPVPLAAVSSILEATTKAVWFKNAGAEHVELVGKVMGNRRRLAAAFNTTETDLVDIFQSRLNNPQPIVEVDSSEAPVQAVIIRGDEVDLTRLPFHPQHQFDGGTYISSGIDFSVDPETGRTNVGCRRLSLRNRREAGTNVTAPSDLRGIYQAAVKRGEALPVNFAIGSHPIDFLAAGMRIPTDENQLISTLRGEPVPMVKGITNDILVPADAEVILEGYLDPKGYCEPEGPFGEYMGYYGPMHMDPIYHVTAITMRHDALFQTVLHGCGAILRQAESANLYALVTENRAITILRAIGINPVQVHSPVSSGECQHLRISIQKTTPDQPRRIFAALFAAMLTLKHIFVVDDDINVVSTEHFEWALATRFQVDRDLMQFPALQGFPMDPSLDGRALATKAGFDLTIPFGQRDRFSWRVCRAPQGKPLQEPRSVLEILASGPKFFVEIMQAAGSNDGRDIALALDELQQQGQLMRGENGEYALREENSEIQW
jgi:2,5-furandicarboxylate decarboxylase 1